MSKKKPRKKAQNKELTISLITVLISLMSAIINLLNILIEKLK